LPCETATCGFGTDRPGAGDASQTAVGAAEVRATGADDATVAIGTAAFGCGIARFGTNDRFLYFLFLFLFLSLLPALFFLCLLAALLFLGLSLELFFLFSSLLFFFLAGKFFGTGTVERTLTCNGLPARTVAALSVLALTTFPLLTFTALPLLTLAALPLFMLTALAGCVMLHGQQLGQQEQGASFGQAWDIVVFSCVYRGGAFGFAEPAA